MIIEGRVKTTEQSEHTGIKNLKLQQNLENNWNILHENADWIFNEEIKIQNKMDNQCIFLNRYFYEKFGSIPVNVFVYQNHIIFFLHDYQKRLLNNQYHKQAEKFLNAFSKKKIFFKVFSNNFGDLIANLFTQVPKRDFKSIRCEKFHNPYYKNRNSKQSDLQIFVNINENSIAYALGRKGMYIHTINQFLRHLTFVDERLKNEIGNKQVFLRT